MVKQRPDILVAGSYGVMDASRALGIDRKTLLNHSKLGLIKYRVNTRGRKVFRGSDMMKYWASQWG